MSYESDVEAMFDRVQGQMAQITRTWLIKVGDYLAIETPGPGNQLEDTEYIAKGVLRMGYDWYGTAPPALATVAENEGDDSYDADAVRAKLSGQLESLTLTGEVWLANTVLYADIVHEGKGRHPYARPFITKAALVAQSLLNEAIAEAR